MDTSEQEIKDKLQWLFDNYKGKDSTTSEYIKIADDVVRKIVEYHIPSDVIIVVFYENGEYSYKKCYSPDSAQEIIDKKFINGEFKDNMITFLAENTDYVNIINGKLTIVNAQRRHFPRRELSGRDIATNATISAIYQNVYGVYRRELS